MTCVRSRETIATRQQTVSARCFLVRLLDFLPPVQILSELKMIRRVVSHTWLRPGQSQVILELVADDASFTDRPRFALMSITATSHVTMPRFVSIHFLDTPSSSFAETIAVDVPMSHRIHTIRIPLVSGCRYLRIDMFGWLSTDGSADSDDVPCSPPSKRQAVQTAVSRLCHDVSIALIADSPGVARSRLLKPNFFADEQREKLSNAAVAASAAPRPPPAIVGLTRLPFGASPWYADGWAGDVAKGITQVRGCGDGDDVAEVIVMMPHGVDGENLLSADDDRGGGFVADHEVATHQGESEKDVAIPGPVPRRTRPDDDAEVIILMEKDDGDGDDSAKLQPESSLPQVRRQALAMTEPPARVTATQHLATRFPCDDVASRRLLAEDHLRRVTVRMAHEHNAAVRQWQCDAEELAAVTRRLRRYPLKTPGFLAF